MMNNSKVGYANPPKRTRFKKGVSGNPKGRPTLPSAAVGEVVTAVMEAAVEYREGGRTRRASRQELSIRRHLKNALKGDVAAAEALLKIRAHAQGKREANSRVIEICDLLPDDTLPLKSAAVDRADDKA